MDKCKKCGGTTITMKQDSRGIPEAYCKECGHFIKKMSTAEVIDFYENILANETVIELAPEKPKEDRPMCRYCTEPIYRRVDRLRYAELKDAKFCPYCGREKKPTDRDY